MKTIFHLIYFLFFINIMANAQVIHGKVYDAESKEAVRYANVYLEGTSIGTVTDSYGRFHFNIKQHRGIPIIVSTIGYQSKREEKFNNNQELIVYLEKKNYLLTETTITAKRISKIRRAKYLNEFRDEFLGISSNAKRSKIQNEKDISFKYEKKTKTLYASSNKPLIIKNEGLGYQITYFLDHFISTREDIYYDGYFFFTELDPKSRDEAKRFKDNRFRAYLGSRLALTRAIYNTNLEQKLFSLYDTNYVKVDSIVQYLPKMSNGDKELCLGQELIVHFGYPQMPRKSRLIPIDSCIRITQEGYFNAKSIKWTDYISSKRVADLLPFEYSLTKKQKAAFDYMK